MEQQKIPSHSRMERKKEATKQKIHAAAIALFKKQSFELTTMEQIAEAADIAKGTLYNYFPVKEAILSDYIQQSFSDRQEERFAYLRKLPDTRSRMTAILSELMQRVQAQSDIFEIYLAYQIRTVVSLRPVHNSAGKSGVDRLALEIIALGQESGEIRADIPIDMLADLFEFVFVEVAKPFYLSPSSYSAPDVIAHAVDLFMHGAKRGS